MSSPIIRYLAISLITLLFCLPLLATNSSAKEAIRVLIIPEVETIFSSEIAATIKNFTVDFGDHFIRDQELIVFDCQLYNSELKKAEAELLEATKTLETNNRLKQLKSVSDLAVEVSQARVNRSQAEVELRQGMVSSCSVKAPFSGRVLNRSANLFQYVTPGQPLLHVIDDVNLTIQLFVPSNWLSWLKPGILFDVAIDETQKSYQAKLMVLGAKVDQVSQTIEIRAKMTQNHSELLAGMSGTAYFK
jgi:RND family efflux transporter MFP subunit